MVFDIINKMEMALGLHKGVMNSLAAYWP